jgi:hypothetical protein
VCCAIFDEGFDKPMCLLPLHGIFPVKNDAHDVVYPLFSNGSAIIKSLTYAFPSCQLQRRR